MGIETLSPPVMPAASRAAAQRQFPAYAPRLRRMDAARFSLSGAAHHRHVAYTLPVAELCRAALMGLYGSLHPQSDASRGRSAIFAGKNPLGAPLLGHGHARYLPTDENTDGLLDHITVYAHDGFDAAHQAALGGLQFLRLPETEERLTVQLVGLGVAEEMGVGPLAKAACWQSATPYVATRFAKTRGKKRTASPINFLISDLAGQLTEFCQRHGGVAVVAIEPVLRDGVFCHPCYGGAGVGNFLRSRVRRADNGGLRHCGYFRVRFTAAVNGPVAAGHNAHFGMGLFLPMGETGRRNWFVEAPARRGHNEDLQTGDLPAARG